MNVTRKKAFFRLRDQLPPAPLPALPLGRTWKPELISKVREELQTLCSILSCIASRSPGDGTSCYQPYWSSSLDSLGEWYLRLEMGGAGTDTWLQLNPIHPP